MALREGSERGANIIVFCAGTGKGTNPFWAEDNDKGYGQCRKTKLGDCAPTAPSVGRVLCAEGEEGLGRRLPAGCPRCGEKVKGRLGWGEGLAFHLLSCELVKRLTAHKFPVYTVNPSAQGSFQILPIRIGSGWRHQDFFFLFF